MGKGKGAVKQWYQLVQPGHVVLRLRGLAGLKLFYLLRQIGRRLPGHLCLLNSQAPGVRRFV